MHLYLLEFTYAEGDRETVEAWLSKARLSGVLISTKQYDDEMFAVLASNRELLEDHKKLIIHPAISSCQAKQRAVYRITTIIAPELVFSSFPYSEGDEWYAGDEKMIYLAVESPKLKHTQIAWLAACGEIVSWDYIFDLVPAPAKR